MIPGSRISNLSGALPVLPYEYRIRGTGIPTRSYVSLVRGTSAYVRRVSRTEMVIGRIFGWLR